MTYLPDRIYWGDRQRESVWEALDAMVPGAQFTLMGLWQGRHGRVGAHYTMVAQVVRDAIALGAVERLGRLPSQGGPWLLRKTGTPPPQLREGMTPPAGWRPAEGGAR